MLNELGDIYQKMERGIRYTIVSLAACTIIVYPFLFMYISSFSSYTFVVQLMLATGTAGAYLSLTTLVSCPVQPPPYAVFVPIPVLAFGELIYLYLIKVKEYRFLWPVIGQGFLCYIQVLPTLVFFSCLQRFVWVRLHWGANTVGSSLKKKLNHADDESFLSLEGSLIFFSVSLPLLPYFFKNSMFPCMAILIKTCSVSIPMIMMHI